MKTVAIVGSEPRTKGLAPYQDNAIEIWTFNQTAKTLPRASAVFQMHSPSIYRDPENKFDKEHWPWLQEEHDFPIYMIDADPDVPASVRYPLKEILAQYPEIEKRMFTQSSCFAFALALFLGYEKVMVYGIENAHYSEYSTEREGFIYWIGFLQGKGLIVERYSGDNMFDNPLYGREFLWEQDKETYTKRLVQLEAERRKTQRTLKKAENFEQWNEAIYFRGVAEGRINQCRFYLDRVKTMLKASGKAIFVPSELKLDRNAVLGLIQEGRNKMEQARGANNMQNYADAALLTANYVGALQEIEYMDEKAKEWQLREDDK